MNNPNPFFTPKFDEKKSDPRECSYKLKARIQVVERSYDDIQSVGSLGQKTRKFVYLIPEMNDQMVAFFTAWLGPVCKGCALHPPANYRECSQPLVEVVLKFGHPFNVYGRASVENPSRIFPEDHHLYLMTYGLSQIIIANPSMNGKTIQVETLPGSSDHPDGSPTDDTDQGDDLLPFEKKKW
jgi:hypothetical protein